MTQEIPVTLKKRPMHGSAHEIGTRHNVGRMQKGNLDRQGFLVCALGMGEKRGRENRGSNKRNPDLIRGVR